MIDIPCRLCGSGARTALLKQEAPDPYLALVDPALEAIERRWFVCAGCGFVYRSPVLADDDRELLYQRYERDVFKGGSPDAWFDRITGLPPSESENHQKAAWLQEVLTQHDAPHATILDVGCGGGPLLHTLGKLLPGARRFGMELNPAYAELAQRRSGAEIVQGAFEPGRFGHPFDLVMLTKVLEHVPDPQGFIALLAEELAPAGLLFLEVPDVSDFARLPPDYQGFFIPHLYYFSAATLSVLLNRAGLDIVAQRTAVTPRNRAFLQILARPGEAVAAPSPPFDDPAAILASRNDAPCAE